MDLPFRREQFLQVFADYNDAVWPAQLLLNAAALVALYVAAAGRPRSGKVVAAILAALWLWTGIVYHLAFFTRVNKAAYLFGTLFTLQAALLAVAGARDPPLTFRFRADARGVAGVILIAYSLLVYPALGRLLGHQYPEAPTFGLPCPTTIYTFGILLWAEGSVPVRLLLIPLAWSLVGTSAAFRLGMFEDFGLPVAAAVGTILDASRYRERRAGGKSAA